jgi:hypothetical protein
VDMTVLQKILTDAAEQLGTRPAEGGLLTL